MAALSFLSNKAGILALIAIAVAIGGFFFFSSQGLTGFAVFSEKSGTVFSISVSGDSAYTFSFNNLKNETLTNATANITLPKSANASNYGSASLAETETAKILSWSFASIGANLNTTLTFTSDAAPTGAKISALDASNVTVSETLNIVETTTTTAGATTTTAANATTTTAVEETTTTSSTTTTTLPPFDYDDEQASEIYSSKIQKARGDNEKLPEGWYIRKEANLENADDTESYEAFVDEGGKKALKVVGVFGDERLFSETITWNGGKPRVKVLYKPIGNEICEAVAVLGFEVLFSDGTGDTTLIFTADNNGTVFGGSSVSPDFYISSKKRGDGWHQLSAKSVLEIESSRKLRFFAAEAAPKCGSGFYISEVSIK